MDLAAAARALVADAGLPALLVAFAVAAVAGLLRGFTGFGFALAAVPGLSLVFAPADVVPCVLLLQVVAGLQLVPATWRQARWRAVLPILAAATVATPLGTAALARLPAATMRIAIGLVLLAATWSLRRQSRASGDAGLGVQVALGILSGLLNGSTAMSGPPVIAYFVGTSAAEEARASLLAYFLLLSVAGSLSAATAGQVGARTVALAVLLLPALLAGNAIGHRAFGAADPATWRRLAIALLTLLGLVAMLRAAA